MKHVARSKKFKKLSKASRKKLLFYCLMLAFPVVQFCIFWIGVNANSLALAFQKYDASTNSYIFDWAFSSLRDSFYDLTHNGLMLTAAKNSAILYLVNTGIGVTLTLFFSFYIYKKEPLSGFYKIMLFLPSIISSVIMVLLYKYFVESVVPEVAELLTETRIKGLLSDENTRFGVLLFYTIWSGFGTQLLVYVGSMENISNSVVEAAKMDGVNKIQEFFYITLPSIWPTLVTFLTVSIAGFFTNQMSLYTFYGEFAPNELTNFGYFLFRETYAVGRSRYPYVASLGIYMTMIAAPVTFLVKFLMERFGPSSD